MFPGLRPGILLTLALGATLAGTAGAGAQTSIELDECRLDAVSVPARCGSLTVFEDRASGEGRTLDLKIVVIPAVSDDAEPDPLFFLAGGPGQAATDLAGPVLPLFADVRRTRDLVFVDQRGTGGSGRMRCAFFESDSEEQAVGESLQFDSLPIDGLRDCLQEVERGRRSATVHDTGRDGRPRRRPRRARLRADQPVRRLLRHPRRARLHTPPSRAGPDRGARRLGSRCHAPAVEHERRRPSCARPAVRRLRRGPGMPRGVPRPAGEDVSRFRAGEAERLAKAGTLGRLSIEVMTDACTVWPAAELPESYFEPVRSDAPALLLSGDLDPVTPPRWGEAVMDGLTNARHIVAPGTGHGVLQRGCTRDVVADFLEAGTHAGLDVSCIEQLRRPPFLLSPAGTDP